MHGSINGALLKSIFIFCFFTLEHKDEQIDVVTESSDPSKSSDKRPDISSSKNHENEISHCRLSPELPRGPAYIAGDHAHVDMDAGKPKIWSVTDFLGSAPHKDVLGFPKLDGLKPDLNQGSLDAARSNLMLGRSPTGPNGLSPIATSAHHISAYQSSLGYTPTGYPYSLSSYGGGKLLRPSVSTAVSRFSPFPSVRSIGMDSPYVTRRDVSLAREGE